MTNPRTIVTPGLTTTEPGYQLIDGPDRVTVGWSDEDAAWIARLTCDDAATHRVQFSPIGIGATQLDALAHLALCIHCAFLAETEPRDPQPARIGGSEA